MHATAIDDAAWASPWRQHQVGEKVALSLALLLTALVAPPWPTTLAVGLVSVALVLGPARIRPSLLAGVMATPAAFVLVGALSVAVGLGGQAAGDAWWRWGPLWVGPEGVHRALALVGHGLAGSLALMVLATTTPMVDLVAWLRRLRVPDPLLDVASLTYRLLWTLLASSLAIREAQRARLGDTASWSRRWRTTGDTVGAVLLRAWHRARRLEDGLVGRGYESCLPTLPGQRRSSWRLRLGGAATLAGIWALAWLVTR